MEAWNQINKKYNIQTNDDGYAYRFSNSNDE